MSPSPEKGPELGLFDTPDQIPSLTKHTSTPAGNSTSRTKKNSNAGIDKLKSPTVSSSKKNLLAAGHS